MSTFAPSHRTRRPTRRGLALLVAAALMPASLAAADEATTAAPAAPLVTTEAADPVLSGPSAPSASSSTSADPFGTRDRRRLDRYAGNLGRNLAGVLAPGNARLLLFGAGLAAGSSLLDNRTASYFDHHSYASAGRTGASLGQGLVVAGLTAGLFGAGCVSHDGRFHDATYDLSQAVLVNTAYTFALKNAVHRERPDGSNALSFPSGHASSAFAAATVLEAHYGAKVGIPAYGIASFIGASRLASKAHHLSDVVAGAALGVVVGRTVVAHDGATVRSRRQLTLGPLASPSGDGVGLALSLGF